MGCAVGATRHGAVPSACAPSTSSSGAGGRPDQINVLYGNSSFFVDQDTFTDSTATSKKLRRRGGFKQGDLAIVAVNPSASAASASCQLIEVTDDDDPDGYTVDHDTAPYTSYYAASCPAVAPRFNAAGSAPASRRERSTTSVPQPRLDSWTIEGNRVLTRTDVLQSTRPPMQVAEGVINLKAEYGVDTNGNGKIDDSRTNGRTLAPADWRQVLAIRVAVLVRSRQFERNGDPGASGVHAVTPSAANPYYFGDRVGRRSG